MNIITKYKKNDKFHTTLVNAIFQIKCDKDEIMALTILSRLLLKTNKKYNSEDIFSKEKLNRYIISYNVLNQSINNVYFLNFSLLLPNEGIISDFNLNRAVNFMLDTIYDTNIYDEELFEREKRIYTEYLLDNYKNIEFIAEKNMLDILDQDCIFNKIKYKDIENIKDLTIDNVIDLYNKYIKNIIPKIFVYGNMEKDNIENIFNNYFKNKKLKSYKLLNDYNVFYNNANYVEKTDYTKFNQSIVYKIYNIKDYNEDDFYKLYLINQILYNSYSDLLFDNLRKKYNLVYSCGSSIMIRNGLLIIKALTSKNNIKLAKIVIDKTIKELINIDDYKDNINRIISRLENNLIREKDNFYIEPTDIINNYFKSDISSEKLLNILKSIRIDELKECISRLETKCTYVLEGV